MKPVHSALRCQAFERVLVLAALTAPIGCSSEPSPSEDGKATSGTTGTTASSAGPTTSGASSTSAGPTATAAGNGTGSTTTGAAATTTGAGMGGDGAGGNSSTSANASTGVGGGTATDAGGATSTSNSTGGSGGSGGGDSAVWPCPAGITGTPTLGTPTRVEGVPPADSFNMNNGTFGNVEGPVWVGDALYLSEMSVDPYTQASPDQKKARILKVMPGGSVSVFVEDSGSNGLAITAAGNLLAAVHKDGSLTQFALPGGAPTVVASGYMGTPFNSPNDLAIHSNGTVYFSDPTFNAPSPPPQGSTYAYRLSSGSEPEPIPNAEDPDLLSNPNGVTLSLAEDYLYVAASPGRRYPVMDDGTLGEGADFPAANGGDGMAIDCAGNLYVTKANSSKVEVYTADGDSIGTITVPGFQAVTNVAFGGADHQTLYITGLGNDKGLFQLAVGIPGRPY